MSKSVLEYSPVENAKKWGGESCQSVHKIIKKLDQLFICQNHKRREALISVKR